MEQNIKVGKRKREEMTWENKESGVKITPLFSYESSHT